MAVLLAGIATSAFGQSVWTTRKDTAGLGLQSIAWTGKLYVAVGVGVILTSPDGVTWTEKRTDDALNSVTWTGSELLAVGDSNTPPPNGGIGPDTTLTVVMSSPDGVTWKEETLGQIGILESVIWAENQFVAVGGNGILTSPDGITWTQRVSGYLYSVTRTGTQLVAVGSSIIAVNNESTDTGLILTSPDGISWTPRGTRTITSGGVLSVVWTGNQLVARGGATGIVTSSDGITWTSINNNSGVLFYLNWTGTQIIGVGLDSLVETSPDGINWTVRYSAARDTDNSLDLNALVFTGSEYVAVGESGLIMTSPQSITSIQSISPLQNSFSLHLSPSLLSFTLPNTFSNSSIAAIYTLSGNKLLESPIGSKSNSFSMPIGNLGMGKYFLEVKDSKDKIVEPFEIGR